MGIEDLVNQAKAARHGHEEQAKDVIDKAAEAVKAKTSDSQDAPDRQRRREGQDVPGRAEEVAAGVRGGPATAAAPSPSVLLQAEDAGVVVGLEVQVVRALRRRR